jgi:hypothetical protein
MVMESAGVVPSSTVRRRAPLANGRVSGVQMSWSGTRTFQFHASCVTIVPVFALVVLLAVTVAAEAASSTSRGTFVGEFRPIQPRSRPASNI